MPDVRGGHPLTDPGDGRTECLRCGKWVHECIHSCKGLPVTASAWNRYLDGQIAAWHDGPDTDVPLHEFLGMTWDEYAAWTSDPAAIPVGWLS